MRTPLAFALLLCVLTGCGSTQEMETHPADTSEVATGPLDESDAKPVMDSMLSEMLESKVLRRWTKNHEGTPRVGLFLQNETMEHSIDTTFQLVTQKLSNTDKVQVDPEIRREIREELMGGHSMCCRKTPFLHALEIAREAEADFLVHGEIHSTQKEKRKGERGDMLYTVVYTIALDLKQLENPERYWDQEKEIKKIVRVPCDRDPSC